MALPNLPQMGLLVFDGQNGGDGSTTETDDPDAHGVMLPRERPQAPALVVPAEGDLAAGVAPAPVVEAVVPAPVMEAAATAVAVVEEAVPPAAVAATAVVAPVAAAVAAAPAAAPAAAVRVPLSAVVAAMVAAAAAATAGGGVEAAAGATVAVGEAGALHAGSSSSSSSSSSSLVKRKVGADFTPHDTGSPWKVLMGADRRGKPAGFKRVDIPAAKTVPIKHDTYSLDEAGGPCNSDGGSDSECIDVVRSVTETTPAPDRDVESRSARVSPIPRSSSPSDGVTPRPSGSPSSCPAGSPAASATHSALCSPSGSPSGSPGVREGGSAGGSPSVGAGGGSPSGATAGGGAGGSAMVGAGGGAVVVSSGGKKKGPTRAKTTGKKKKPEAAAKTQEVLALEAFDKSMQPEPPVHAVVPETPTPWAYLPSDKGGPAEDRDFSTTVAREALQNMVWDRRHFVLQPVAMEVESGGGGGGGGGDVDVGCGGGDDDGGRGGGDGGGGGCGSDEDGGGGGSGCGFGGEEMLGPPDASASAEALSCARLLPLSDGRAPYVNMEGPLAAPSPIPPPSALVGAAVGDGKATATIREGFLSPKVECSASAGEILTGGGLGMEDGGVSGGLGGSVGSVLGLEEGDDGGGGEGGGGEKQGLVAPSPPSPSRPGAKGTAKGLAACSPSTRSGGNSLKRQQDRILDMLGAGRTEFQKDLIQPQEYGGTGGYFENMKQPFAVKVHPNVQYTADVHSYMVDTAEIIGFLAGHYDKEARVLYIQAAVPCLEEERDIGDRGNTEVEVSPMSFFNASQAIERLGLQMVGWYHSHPTFNNIPSPIDVCNHGKLQAGEKEPGSSGAWVGLIVGRERSPSTFRFFRNEPTERLNADGQLETVSCPMLLHTTLATSKISAAAVSTAVAAAAALPTAAAAAPTTAASPIAPPPTATASTAGDASGSGLVADESTVLSGHGAGRREKRVDWAAAARLKRKSRRDKMRGEARAKDMARRRTKARLEEAVLDPAAAASGGGPTAAPSLPPPSPPPPPPPPPSPPPAAVASPHVTQPPPYVNGYPVGQPANGEEHSTCVPAWSDDIGGRSSSSDDIGGSPGCAKAVAVAALDRLRAVLPAEHVAGGGQHVLGVGLEAAGAGAGGAAPPPPPAAAPAAGAADAARMSPWSLDVREAGLTPGAPEASEAYWAATATVAAAAAPLVQPQACESGGGAGGQSPTARGAGGDSGGGGSDGSGCDRGGSGGGGGGVSGGVSGGGGGSYEGDIGGGKGAPVNTTPTTGIAGGTTRARLFEKIAEIARNPPLNFSEDILQVLKGDGGKEPPGLAGSQEGSTDEGIGGYGPQMDRAIDSLMSLGRFYSRVKGRAPMCWGNKTGTSSLENLARSLAQAVNHMELHPSEADDFIEDTCSFLLSCFRETDLRNLAKSSPNKRKKPAAGVHPSTRPKRSRRNADPNK